MSKHTPGPWAVDTWDYSQANPPKRELAVQTPTHRIAVVDWDAGKDNPYTIPDAEAKANARLIAAAPLIAEELVITRRLLREVAANILIEGDARVQLNERARRINELLMGALLEDAVST